MDDDIIRVVLYCGASTWCHPMPLVWQSQPLAKNRFFARGWLRQTTMPSGPTVVSRASRFKNGWLARLSCHLCRAEVGHLATHGLSCRKSLGRHPRHAAINDLVKSSLASLEPRLSSSFSSLAVRKTASDEKHSAFPYCKRRKAG